MCQFLGIDGDPQGTFQILGGERQFFNPLALSASVQHSEPTPSLLSKVRNGLGERKKKPLPQLSLCIKVGGTVDQG